jgi:tetratricopeptide (TPR) repeat protein
LVQSLLFIALATPALAQDFRDQVRGCNDAIAAPGEVIRACSSAIQSGRLRGVNLGIAYYRRGLAYVTDGVYSNAAGDFTQAIILNPTAPEPHVLRGMIFHLRGEHRSAVTDLDTGLRLDPTNALAYSFRGLAWSAIGLRGGGQEDFERAVADHSNAIRIDPSIAASYADRGVAQTMLGNRESAINDFNEALRLDPEDIPTRQNRCRTRAELNRDLSDALADCNAANEARPNNPIILTSRALVHMRLGDLTAAYADYDAALRADAERPEALYGRGLAQLRLGRIEAGQADIATALTQRADVADEFNEYGLTP